jgi:TolB-like protein
MRTITLCCVFALALTPATPSFAADEPAKPTRVLVMPFESLSSEADAAARVIQRSLLLELNRLRNIHALEFKKVAADTPDPLVEGKAHDAAFVLSASVQVADRRVRVIGQVLDLQKQNSQPSHFKLTGSLGELFEFQDLLAEQVRRRVSLAQEETDETPEAVEIPPSEPLRVAPSRRREAQSDEMQYRYNVLPDAYCYGYAPSGYRYRSYRPLYESRYYDYTYRGLPDRRACGGFYLPPLYTFDCPIPLRWMRYRY